MQLLSHRGVRDYAAWRRVFDEDAEQRRDAGLSLLQIWREAGSDGGVWLLFEVQDRARAAAYLEGLGSLHADQGGVTERADHFVETA